tara:strand:+ start:96 stop:344 length:249 start_codon:yes stop_codon:yes gene_type:complete
MIDTDKYEGHTGPWKPHTIQPLYGNMVLFGFNEQDSMLSADAPLLLEEVKDLQKKLDNLREYCHAEGYDIFNWEVKNIEVIE